MAKQIIPAELAEIVTILLTDPASMGELEDGEQYLSFIQDIGEVVANHCGGEISQVHRGIQGAEGEEAMPMLSVYPNDSLPSLKENVWARYDPQGWEEEQEV